MLIKKEQVEGMDLTERRILLLVFLSIVFLAINFSVYSIILQVSGVNLSLIFKAFIYLTLFLSLSGVLIMFVNYLHYKLIKSKEGGLL